MTEQRRRGCGVAVATLCAAIAACSAPTPEAPAATRPASEMPPPQGPRLFVSNEIAGTVSVIDIGTRAVVHTIPVGKRPRGIRVSPDGRTVYVALSGSPIGGPNVDESTLPPADRKLDGIGVIDAATGRLVKMLPSGSDPEQFAISKDGTRLFIANEDAGLTSVLEVATGTILAQIKVGGEPEGVDLSPDGRVVYVTSEYDNAVYAIDTNRLTLVREVPVGPRPRSTGFLPDGSLAYVSAENGPLVSVLDARTHAVLASIPFSPDTLKPMGVVVTPDGTRVLVTTGRGGTLHAIEVATNRITGSVAVGERPWGVEVSADGKWAFTANGPSNDVAIVDLATMTVAAKVPVGERPWGLAIVP
jgi:YVTN family beta-propeller protein